MNHLPHRGHKVAEVLIDKGIGISSLENMFYLDQGHVEILLSDRFLDFEIISYIGKNVGYDFSKEFPEMSS